MTNTEPVYGLMAKWRPYKCDCCGNVRKISTNHTGPCWPTCPNCSWRSAYDSDGNHYRADTQKNRPQFYVGAAPTNDEINPHARKELS